MKEIAFIGTREPELRPEAWVKLYCDAVVAAVQHGYRIVTGGAPGCDQLAANRALSLEGEVRLVLPRWDFEREWVQTVKHTMPARVSIVVYDPKVHMEWTASVAEYHGAPEKLGPHGLQQMARNYGIVVGPQAVVALPSGKRWGGGTGQGITICKARGIKLFDLSQEEGRAALQAGLLKAPSAP